MVSVSGRCLSAAVWAILTIVSLMLACGDDVTNMIVESQDEPCLPGVEWTKVAYDHFHDIGWFDNQFVAVGASAGGIHTSSDGRDWTEVLDGEIYHGDIAWSGSIFVAVGDSLVGNDVAWTSPDGLTWTQGSSPMEESQDIVWAGDKFVVVGHDGRISTSVDGVDWTERTVDYGLMTPPQLMCAAWSGNEVVALSILSDVAVRSLDGVSWDVITDVYSAGSIDVTWLDTMFVAVGTDGLIMQSSDGTSWIFGPTPTGADLLKVAWSGHRCVVVGRNDDPNVFSEILTSPDGYIWTRRFSGVTEIFRSVAFAGELCKFVAVGEHIVLESTN